MRRLAERLGVTVEPVEAIGFDGDAIEAQCFAYLALRSRRGAPLSLPDDDGRAGADDRRRLLAARPKQKGPAFARPFPNDGRPLLADVDAAGCRGRRR